MLRAAIKFCGGCNPRFDRGAAYDRIRRGARDAAAFESPQEGVAYDLLLIVRGCTGCPYLYEDVRAAHRLVFACEDEEQDVINAIRALDNKEEKT